jgi:hypothetical protein
MPVEVVMTDGQTLKGTLLVRREVTLRDTLNGAGPFLEFECGEAGTIMISKASIRTLRQYVLPRATPLPAVAAPT